MSRSRSISGECLELKEIVRIETMNVQNDDEKAQELQTFRKKSILKLSKLLKMADLWVSW